MSLSRFWNTSIHDYDMNWHESNHENHDCYMISHGLKPENIIYMQIIGYFFYLIFLTCSNINSKKYKPKNLAGKAYC